MLAYDFIKTVNEHIRIYSNFPLPVIICDTDFQVYWANRPAKTGFHSLTMPDGMRNTLAELEHKKLLDGIEEEGSVTLSDLLPFSDVSINLSPIITKSGTAGIMAMLINAQGIPPHASQSGMAAVAFSDGIRRSVSSIFDASDSAYLKSVMMDGQQWLSPHLKRISQSAYGILRTAANFTEYARLQNGNAMYDFETIDIFTWLRGISETVCELAENAGVPTTFSIEDGAAFVSADIGAFETAFYNIIYNSLLFTSENNHIEVSAFKSDGGVAVEIADAGFGMDDETLKNAFKPYFVSPNAGGGRGAGLGLAIARIVMEAHGGDIVIESKPGEGTRVTLSLPPLPFSYPLPLGQVEAAMDMARLSVKDRFSKLYVGLMGIYGEDSRVG